MKCVVNTFETMLCCLIMVSALIWMMYNLVKAQTEIFSNDPYISLKDLSAGWRFLNREKDISDTEWSCVKYYIQKSWLYLTFQFLISELLRQFHTSAVKYWYIMSSMFFITFYMGAVQLLVILIQPLIFFILILCGGKQISTWVTSLAILLCFDIVQRKYYFWQFLDYEVSQEEKVFLLFFARAWVELRCISYCLDYIERQEKFDSGEKSHSENSLHIFINLFSYVLYLPVLYLGPIILYGEFANSFQNKSEKLWTRLKTFSVDIVIFATYSFLLELASHFVYFNAMHSDMELVKQLPPSALAGGGLWMGTKFYVKYVVAYGTTAAITRLDNMEPPPTPRCVGRIHIYSNMWRYFDVGLYKFLLKYIFKPCYATLCKSTLLSKSVNKLIASFNTFVFIFLWHGITLNIFIWSVSNYIGILLEHIARAQSNTGWYKHFEDTVLKTDAMKIRLNAALCAPLLVASLVSSFYLYGGAEVGNFYVGLLQQWPTLHNLIIVSIVVYSWCYVSIKLINVPSRTEKYTPSVKVD